MGGEVGIGTVWVMRVGGGGDGMESGGGVGRHRCEGHAVAGGGGRCRLDDKGRGMRMDTSVLDLRYRCKDNRMSDEDLPRTGSRSLAPKEDLRVSPSPEMTLTVNRWPLAVLIFR